MQILKKSIFIITVFLFIFSGKLFCLAQQTDTSEIKELVPQLIEAYEHFDYNRCSVLLEIAFKNLKTFSNQDLKNIYLYSAFLEFREGNTIQASQYFWDILTADPTYTLDPITTPPKLLVLFQKTKIEFLEDLNKRFLSAELDNNPPPFPWRALVFPGWEQWHRDYKTKGLILVVGGLATLTGTIVSIIQTNERKNDYQQASDLDIIKARYDSYQAAYQRQFYFGYAFLGIWAFSHFDLVVWSQTRFRLTTSLEYNSEKFPYPSAQFILHF